MVKFLVSDKSYIPIVKRDLLRCIKNILIEVYKGNIDNQALYISFNKNDDGVVFPVGISDEDLVTIVLQNQFWDLSVDHNGFEVMLDFFNERHTIYVTFSSIVLFVDPIAHFYIDLRDLSQQGDIDGDSDHFDDDDSSDDQIIEINL
jgi:hypothetical protein